MTPHPDGCDYCGNVRELYYDEPTGLALCDNCLNMPTGEPALTEQEVAEREWTISCRYTNDRRYRVIASNGETGEVREVVRDTLESALRTLGRSVDSDWR